jgi:putative nucleotidyltransferase with HDIG domain
VKGESTKRLSVAERWQLSIGFNRLSLVQRFALVSFVVFVALGFGLYYRLSQSIQETAIDAAVQTAQDTLQARLIAQVPRQQLKWAMVDEGTRTAFEKALASGVLSHRTVRVKVWDERGRVIYSSEKSIIGKSFPIKDELKRAIEGKTAAEVSSLTSAENRGDRALDSKLLEVYLPIRYPHDPHVYGVFEIYQRYAPVASQIDRTERMVTINLSAGLLVLYLLLFGIVRSGSRTIARQQRTLLRYTGELEESYNQTIASLAAALDVRDSSTEEHSLRVTELSVALATWLGWDAEAVRAVERGALLHDVGKIGISDTILLKPGPLTDEEWEVMCRHPVIGYDMLRSISFLDPALAIVRHHHERWDGTGYPDRLAGEDIPESARLFAVVDAYDAITADRPYRRGSPHSIAIEIILHDAGTHFDPSMAAAFADMMQERSKLVEQVHLVAV